MKARQVSVDGELYYDGVYSSLPTAYFNTKLFMALNAPSNFLINIIIQACSLSEREIYQSL